MDTTYTPIIGLEIHVELATESKMFCGCRNDPFYAPKPNMYTCPTCLGLPGGLPVPNAKAIDWALKLGLALGCEIADLSKFDRKNYFYPDLAKGYQISQYDQPFCRNGIITLPEGDVRIHRVHLEEDTGKLMHTTVDGNKVTLVDFNRSGVPLVEIVTEPDVRSGEQAKAFLKKLHQIIRYLEISNADMEKGSMRLEPNISVLKGPFTGELPPYKVEVKNINSFSFVKRAIDYEIQRHIGIIEEGSIPKQETRGYVEANSSTVSQRSKETAADYRYFPEPDIPPFRFEPQKIQSLKDSLPELPDAKRDRWKREYGLGDAEISVLIETPQDADYFESCISLLEGNDEFSMLTPKTVANAKINQAKGNTHVSPLEFLTAIRKKHEDNNVDEFVIRAACERVVTRETAGVADFRNGKESALMFLLGQVKRELKGKGEAARITDELLRLLKTG